MKIAILIIAIILMFVSNSFAKGGGHSVGHSRGHALTAKSSHQSTKKFVPFHNSKFTLRHRKT